MQSLEPFTFDYPFHAFSTSVIIQADSFEWLRRIPPASIHECTAKTHHRAHRVHRACKVYE